MRLVLTTQSIVNAVEAGWSTAGRTLERDKSVQSYHDLSQAVFLYFGTKPFFLPRLSANLAGYKGYGLPRPESRDYLCVDAIKGIKDITTNDVVGINIKIVNGLS
jgi:hypothetical protein